MKIPGERLRSIVAGALTEYAAREQEKQRAADNCLSAQSGCCEKTGDVAQPTGFASVRVTAGMLREALSARREPLELISSPKGKPYMACRPGEETPPFYFSLSHSGDLVVCAVSDSEVGVDVQAVKKNAGQTSSERIWRHFFAEEERELLSACADSQERERLFYRLWVQKEAYGKYTGEGVAAVLALSPGLHAKELGIVMEEFEPAPGYYGAVCRTIDKEADV